MCVRAIGMGQLSSVLAWLFYDAGDLARAHNYLSVALEEALAGGAKTNSMMISAALMPVSQALREQERTTFIMLVGLIVCLCGVSSAALESLSQQATAHPGT